LCWAGFPTGNISGSNVGCVVAVASNQVLCVAPMPCFQHLSSCSLGQIATEMVFGLPLRLPQPQTVNR